VLVRSWNLFNGNTVPPQREGFLDEMVSLASGDDPDVLCLQEVPAWALARFTIGDVAARPRLGRELGRAVTELHHGVIRSALAGQGNAIHVSARMRVLEHRSLPLNPRRFRSMQARELGLDLAGRLAWARERRIVQVARVARDGRTFTVANLHCTTYARDDRLADAELLRAAWFAMSVAAPDDVLVLAGDFNVTAERSRTLAQLSGPDWGFSPAGEGIDHILVRGAASGPLHRWPDERRRRAGVLLSDHAPVELDVDLG
jgi:endonuclease/exonuclease/phosphatase family metal-dependent hydrolase